MLVDGANAAAMMSTCCLKANYKVNKYVGHRGYRKTYLDVHSRCSLHQTFNQNLHLRVASTLDSERCVRSRRLLHRRA